MDNSNKRLYICPDIDRCDHCLEMRSGCCRQQRLEANREDKPMEENDHPKGALVLIFGYLLFLSGMWLNVYLHLFGRGWPQ